MLLNPMENMSGGIFFSFVPFSVSANVVVCLVLLLLVFPALLGALLMHFLFYFCLWVSAREVK